MKIIPLPLETQAQLGVNTKIVLDYTDFNGTGVTNQGNTGFTAAWTSGTAQCIDPMNLQAGQVGVPQPIVIGATTAKLPAGMVVKNTIVNVTNTFTSSGGVISALTLSLGDGGSGTRFANAVSLLTAQPNLGSTTPYLETAAFNLLATLSITGQTVASLNAGTLEIYCDLVPVTDLESVT